MRRNLRVNSDVTVNRDLVTLVENVETAARANLTTAYERFMAEHDPAKKSEVGEDLIRAIFGSVAIAEDPLR